MISEHKLRSLAKLIINHSCSLKKNENVLIEAIDVPYFFIEILIEEIFKKNAYPFLSLKSEKFIRKLGLFATKKYYKIQSNIEINTLQKMNAFIGIKNVLNAFELSDLSHKKHAIIYENYLNPVHFQYRNNRIKWVYLRWPSESMAQRAEMSIEKFQDYYFNACNINYKKLYRAMENLAKLLYQTDKVHIIGPNDTDLSFSINGIGVYKSTGRINIPDGEIFTAPIKNSINGFIKFNIPSIYQGNEFRNVSLKINDGKIIHAKSDINQKKLNSILNQDKGAKYFGEFAFGLNPIINIPIKEILFDEKINTSIHFAIGNSYKEADNGNRSSIHWDLILNQNIRNGGGEIYFDNILIRKDGKFVTKELLCLNPENLFK